MMQRNCATQHCRSRRTPAAVFVAVAAVAAACGGSTGSAGSPGATASADVATADSNATASAVGSEPSTDAPVDADEFFDRLAALEREMGVIFDQPVSAWRSEGIAPEQLVDICTEPFAGVPPDLDPVAAQREFATVVAACPTAVADFADVHPPSSPHHELLGFVQDAAAVADSSGPGRGDDGESAAPGPRPLVFLPTEVGESADFLSGDFPAAPQPDGAVVASLSVVDDRVAVSFSSFDPEPEPPCLYVALMPVGDYVRQAIDGHGDCSPFELEPGHPAADRFRSPSQGTVRSCDGGYLLVSEWSASRLSEPGVDAVEIGLTSTNRLAVRQPFEGESYFVPLFAGYDAPIDDAVLGEAVC